jgi:hypothetical protein
VQEAQRKDVERAFGVLQKRFGIVLSTSRVLETLAANDMLHYFA